MAETAVATARAVRFESDQADSERRRIARELHDSVAQTLTEMCIELENMRRTEPAALDLDAALGDLQRSARSAVRAMRDILFEEREPDLGQVDVIAELRRMALLFEARTNIPVLVVGTAAWPRMLDTGTAGEILAIVEAALANVRFHSDATGVRIRLQTANAGLALAIADDGTSANRSIAGVRPGLGMLGMGERAALIGGELSARPLEPRGFEVRLTVPRVSR